MTRTDRVFGGSVFVAMLATLLAACGGGSGSNANVGASPTPPIETTPPPPVVIEGIATPSSVAVVTATNAG
jgi:hypothetical protein